MYTSNLKIKEGFTANATTPLGGNYTMRIEEELVCVQKVILSELTV